MLPRIELQTYDFTIPSSDKTIRFRPYTVKEQKLLLIAAENLDSKEIFSAVKQIITNCIVSPENFNVDTLSSFDLDLLFLNLRARSVGETVNLTLQCKTPIDGPVENGTSMVCNNTISFVYNVLDAKVIKDPKHTKTIPLTDSVTIVMKYPSLSWAEKLFSSNSSSKVDISEQMIIDCIDYISDKENIYYRKDTSDDELKDFIERLPRGKFAKIEEFFDTMPFIQSMISETCSKCGHLHEFKVDGLESFLD